MNLIGFILQHVILAINMKLLKLTYSLLTTFKTSFSFKISRKKFAEMEANLDLFLQSTKSNHQKP